MLVYDNTYLKEPNLWTPGKAPSGPVKMNTSHVLYPHVRHFFVPAAHGFVDVADGGSMAVPMRGGHFSRETTDSTKYSYSIKNRRNYWDRDGADGWTDDLCYIAKVNIRNTSTSFRRVFRLARNTDPDFDQHTIQFSIASGNNLLFQVYTNGSLLLYLMSSAGYSTNTWMTLAMQAKNNGSYGRIYKDGELFTTVVCSDRTWSEELNTFFVGDSATGDAWDLEYVIFFSALLSDEWHRRLKIDPYQLLKAA